MPVSRAWPVSGKAENTAHLRATECLFLTWSCSPNCSICGLLRGQQTFMYCKKQCLISLSGPRAHRALLHAPRSAAQKQESKHLKPPMSTRTHLNPLDETNTRLCHGDSDMLKIDMTQICQKFGLLKRCIAANTKPKRHISNLGVSQLTFLRLNPPTKLG